MFILVTIAFMFMLAKLISVLTIFVNSLVWIISTLESPLTTA